MKIVRSLCSLALHQLMGDRAESLLDFFNDNFTDGSQRVAAALYIANQRAWKATELSLAGESWWQRCKNRLTAREEQGFRQQIDRFLQSAPAIEWAAQKPNFRKYCLAEMKAAQKAGLIPGDQPTPEMLIAQAQEFSHFTNPQEVVESEISSLGVLAQELHRQGHEHLAEFVSLRPQGDQALLVIAVRYFFRREVENDRKLAAGLTFQQLENLSVAQEAGFRGIHEALAEQGQRLEQLLENVQEVVVETRDEVREMRDELREQNQQLQGELHELYQAVQQLLEKQNTPAEPVADVGQLGLDEPTKPSEPASPAPSEPEVAPLPSPIVAAETSANLPPIGASASSSPSAEETASNWEQVQQLLERGKALPKEEQKQCPALFRALGRLKAKAFDENSASSLKQIQGPLVNQSLFNTEQPAEEPEQPNESKPTEEPPAEKSPLISSIFLQNQGKKDSNS